MGDVIGVVVVLGLPFVLFVWSRWRHEEAERRRRTEDPTGRDPSEPGKDSYWGGMGRPGR